MTNRENYLQTIFSSKKFFVVLYHRRTKGNRKLITPGGEITNIGARWAGRPYQSPVFILVKVRSLDVEKPGQDVDENLPDPGCHLVGLGASEVNVEHENCYTDAEHFNIFIRYSNIS